MASKFVTALNNFFKKLGKIVAEAFVAAGGRGLTDDIVAQATTWVRIAANKALDNAQKREFVVDILVAKGFPESVARLAVELAVQVIKRELEAATEKE